MAAKKQLHDNPVPATSCLSSALQQLYSVLQRPLSWSAAQRLRPRPRQDIDPTPADRNTSRVPQMALSTRGPSLAGNTGDNKMRLWSCRCWNREHQFTRSRNFLDSEIQIENRRRNAKELFAQLVSISEICGKNRRIKAVTCVCFSHFTIKIPFHCLHIGWAIIFWSPGKF